ncbi:MAG: hypothetical protein KAJ52_06680 [Sedimentisphaerales bacterium]|nr:hypothetical protein [Sedimentisphaerales bacterium]
MLKTEKNQGISYYRGIMLLVLAGVLLVVSVPNRSYAMSPQLVATFADPALGGDTPLFIVDFGYPGTLTGGWGDDQVGLNLEIAWTGAPVYEDAFFVFEPIAYYGDITGGATGAGVIEFYEDGDTEMTEALLKLEFGSAHLNLGAVYAHSIFVDNVTISGTGIPDILDMEEFSFSFANKQPLGGDGWVNATGFTATASFTSSAIPEPVSLGLLSLGSLVLLRAGRRPVARR